jgi:fibronectin type 3 domain-containing protein
MLKNRRQARVSHCARAECGNLKRPLIETLEGRTFLSATLDASSDIASIQQSPQLLSVTSTALASPANVRFTVNSQKQVAVTWDAAAGADRYRLYRSTDASNIPMYVGGIYSTTFTDFHPIAGASKVYWQIAAVDASGYAGARSQVLAVDMTSLSPSGDTGGGTTTTPPPTTSDPTGSVVAAINVLANSQRVAPAPVFVEASPSVIKIGSASTATYEWDFGDSSPQTVVDPITGGTINLSTDQRGFSAAYQYLKPGTYTIHLTVTDEAGNSATTATNVTISADTRARKTMTHNSAVTSAPSNTWVTYPGGIDDETSNSRRTTLNNTVFDLGANDSTVRWTANPTGETSLFVFSGSGIQNVSVRGGTIGSTNGNTDANNHGDGIDFYQSKSVSVVDTHFTGTTGGASLKDAIRARLGSGALVQNVDIDSTESYGMLIDRQTHFAFVGGDIGPSQHEHDLRVLAGAPSQFVTTSYSNIDYGNSGGGKNVIRYGAVNYGTVDGNDLSGGVLQIGFHVLNDAQQYVAYGQVNHVIVSNNRIDPTTRGVEIYQANDVTFDHNLFVQNGGGTMFGTRAETQLPAGVASNVTLRDNTFAVTLNTTNYPAIIDTTDVLDNGLMAAKDWTLEENKFALPSNHNKAVLNIKSGQFKKIEGNTFTDLGDNHTYAKVDGNSLNWAGWVAYVKSVNGGWSTETRSSTLTPASVT